MLSSAWARRQAAINYEHWHNETFGTHLDTETTVDKLVNCSLGIDGWALMNFGNYAEGNIEVPPPMNGEDAGERHAIIQGKFPSAAPGGDVKLHEDIIRQPRECGNPEALAATAADTLLLPSFRHNDRPSTAGDEVKRPPGLEQEFEYTIPINVKLKYKAPINFDPKTFEVCVDIGLHRDCHVENTFAEEPKPENEQEPSHS